MYLSPTYILMKCSADSLSVFSEIMKDVSQPTRLQILCMLSKVDSLCVCEIEKKLKIKQNLVSHHLGILHDLGLVKRTREGKNIHYAINTKKFATFKKNLQDIFNI